MSSLIRQIKNLQNGQKGPKQKKCKNCGGPHASWDCTSKKCHFPGCNAAQFNSAEDRKQHFAETHGKHARDVTNDGSSRGNPQGRGGRGGRGGGRGSRGGGRGPVRDHASQGDASRVNRTVTWDDTDFRACIRYESDDDE